MNLLKAVKFRLLERDMTMVDLSDEMGVNRKTLYSAISNGNPRLSTLQSIAEALEWKPSEMVAEAERRV